MMEQGPLPYGHDFPGRRRWLRRGQIAGMPATRQGGWNGTQKEGNGILTAAKPPPLAAESPCRSRRNLPGRCRAPLRRALASRGKSVQWRDDIFGNPPQASLSLEVSTGSWSCRSRWSPEVRLRCSLRHARKVVLSGLRSRLEPKKHYLEQKISKTRGLLGKLLCVVS